MAKKDMKDVFLQTMSGSKTVDEAIKKDEEKQSEDSLSLKNLNLKNTSTGTRKLVPVYLTDDEHEKLKDFAMSNGFSRKVRGEDKIDGNLSQLMQHLASQL